MPDNSSLFDNPIVMMVAVGLAIGLVGAGLGRFVSPITRLTPAAVFLGSYYAAYGAIPDFPPIASTGKVFYGVIALAVLGLVFDYALKARSLAAVCAVILPALLVLWIGYNRLVNAFSVELGIVAIIFVVIGALALLWTRAIDTPSASASHDAVASVSFLLALAIGYAPIALIGGSSTGLGLLAGFAAGLGMIGLVQFAFPSTSLGWTGVLPGLGGLLALNDSVTLINGKMDFLLLTALCLCLVLGQVVGRQLSRLAVKSPRLGQLIVGLSTVIPSLAVVGLALLRHADAFHP